MDYCAKHPELLVGVCETANLEEAFKELDNDGSGVISLREFIGACLDAEDILDKNMLREAFKIMDRDRDGILSPSELEVVIREVEARLDPNRIGELVTLI